MYVCVCVCVGLHVCATEHVGISTMRMFVLVIRLRVIYSISFYVLLYIPFLCAAVYYYVRIYSIRVKKWVTTPSEIY